jgi:hypothetical protein
MSTQEPEPTHVAFSGGWRWLAGQQGGESRESGEASIRHREDEGWGKGWFEVEFVEEQDTMSIECSCQNQGKMEREGRLLTALWTG